MPRLFQELCFHTNKRVYIYSPTRPLFLSTTFPLFPIAFPALFLQIPSRMSSSDSQKPVLKLVDSSLRISVIPLSVATIWLTVTNKEDNSIYGEVKFSSLLGLKYMVCISAISAGYAFLASVATWIRCLVTKAWLFFVSDQIIAYLMVTSVAAVMEIVYLAYNGDQKVTWSEACSSYGKFCNRMKVALILHAIVVCCFIVLAVISAYRVFSLFEPPLSSKDQLETERT